MWAIIVESKVGLGQESMFEFKYIPDMSKMTGREDSAKTDVTNQGIERRNLKAFLCGCFILTMVSYLAFKTLVEVVRALV